MSPEPLKVLVRADANPTQGSGHVMRCLTLARELAGRGHTVELAVTVDGIPWLTEAVLASGLSVVPASAGSVDVDAILDRGPDWVVVDSYEFSPAALAALHRRVRVLAIVDGDLRGAQARVYLDQNLGAELDDRVIPDGSELLLGATYALVRPEIRAARRDDPWRLDGPRVCSRSWGGTDATGVIVEVAACLSTLERPLIATVVARAEHRDAVAALLSSADGARVVEPSSGLDRLLASADIVVSAAGTSAWEVGTLGLPSVLLAVVDNQRGSLAEAVRRRVTLGIDIAGRRPGALEDLTSELRRLIDDESLRKELSHNAGVLFDGLGAARVAQRMEQISVSDG